MKKQRSMKLLALTLSLAAQVAVASDVTGLTSFTAGTPARAADVNTNFTAVKTAVDDNQAQITALEGVNAETRLSTLETTASGGNIVLAPSTATTGNILKNAIPFLHNFGPNNSNTFLGLYAGNFTMTGYNNTASGYLAFASNTSGLDNTASGVNALRTTTTGNSNAAFGVSALFGSTSGSNNTASGAFALEGNTTGTDNTANGYASLRSNATGNQNTASGYASLYYNTGFFNTAFGYLALYNNSTGNNNIALGHGAGSAYTTGDYNIAIGNSGVGGEANTIRIGSNNQTRAFIAGIRGRTTGAADAIAVVVDSNGQRGTVSASRRVKDHITDMGEASSTLMQLRPVTFYYKADQNPEGRALQYGLIAEEVEKVAPELVAHSANGEIETVYYQHLTPMLLNEYQKQQRLIETQTTLLAKQTARIAQLEKQGQEIVALKRQLERVTVALSHLNQPEKIASIGR